MSEYCYEKISQISLSSSSSGMMMNSNRSLTELLEWKDDGSVTMTRTEIRGTERDESVFAVSDELAEKVRDLAERADMASWGELKYEEDPVFQCTDYSSSSSGKIILDLRSKGGKPYEIVAFSPRAVNQNGKDKDLTALYELFQACQDPSSILTHSKNITEFGMGMMGSVGVPNAFRGMSMSGTVPSAKDPGETAPSIPKGSWKCSCGEINTGKFCCNCGMKCPE